jgi:hypothetical protein
LVIGDEGGVGGLKGYEDLPPWVKEGREPDPALRDETGAASVYESGGRNITASDRLDAAAGSNRAPEISTSPTKSLNGVGASKGKEKTLDDWLAEESGESEEESDDDEEEDEESEYETEDEETESEDEGEGHPLVK